MSLTLTEVPGFNDLPNTALAAGLPAFGLHLGAMAENAAAGMVGKIEVFQGFYKDGDNVPLPTSTYDGYPFTRQELIYLWATRTSVNAQSGFITGPDSLWYAAWKVDQTTGDVFCTEYYRRSGSTPNGAQSNDGVLQVFTIATRRRGTLTIAATPVFSDVADASIAVDKAWTDTIAQQLNTNSKATVVSREAIYMNEYIDSDTVPRPVSPIDGHVYTYAETKFMFSWRWTSGGATFAQPALADGQLGPMKASINATTGAVSVTVQMVNGGLHTLTGAGRIMVIAFCTRDPGITALASGFVEQTVEQFLPPNNTERAATLTVMNNNIREAIQTPEFFGPTSQKNGDTISLPVGADGYTYNANELAFLWEWEDTTPNTGSNLRVASFTGWVGPTGAVSLKVVRLPPGGPYVDETSNGNIRARVLIVAMRERAFTPPTAATITTPSDATSAGSGGSQTAGNIVDNQGKVGPFAIPMYTGMGRILDANEVIGIAIVPGDITTITWPASLTGSYMRSLTAATASTVFTIKKNISGTETTLGTATFAIGATTASFSFTSAVTQNPGEEIKVYAPATPDVTLAGVYGTLSGTRA